MENIKMKYTSYYSNNYLGHAGGRHCYPVEFVVRTLLGSSYPNLKINREYNGKRILDLGCGDGRNIPLLRNCGMEVSGVEITSEICTSVTERMKTVFGISPDIRQGTNAAIPFEQGYFDYLLACHSLYYVEEGTTFSDNVREVARVLKTGGYAILSLPDDRGTILHNAIPCGTGHYQIAFDPLGLRQGSIFRVFSSKDEIRKTFYPYFGEFSIGHCDDDYFGFVQSMWIVCMQRQ